MWSETPSLQRVSKAEEERACRSYMPPVPLADNTSLLKTPLPSNHAAREEYISKVMKKAQSVGASSVGGGRETR
jgi:hypothetical protein